MTQSRSTFPRTVEALGLLKCGLFQYPVHEERTNTVQNPGINK